MVIVQHYPHSAKHYAEASPSPGVLFPIPDTCPACGAVNLLIRWGFYERWVYMGDERFTILIQRVRCNACEHTHSLLPDFLHPYRRYAVSLLQRVVFLYFFAGLGIERLTEHLPCQKPPRSTAREWITSFAYGAGRLLLDLLRRRLMELNPLAELPETPPRGHQEVQGRLSFALQECLPALITGDVGTGKSTGDCVDPLCAPSLSRSTATSTTSSTFPTLI